MEGRRRATVPRYPLPRVLAPEKVPSAIPCNLKFREEKRLVAVGYLGKRADANLSFFLLVKLDLY
jgi:hypothetical protein